MAILSLPQFEADLAEYEREQAEAERASRPESVVVRFGKMGHIAELPYSGQDRLGCKHKLIIRSRRGTEVAQVLTTACSNGSCGSSLTREGIREYIRNSGDQDYPFTQQGRVLRLANADDLLRQRELESKVKAHVMDARERANRFGLSMKVVDVEPILGGELLTVYFVSEDRVDFRALVSDLAGHHRTRIEMRQVGARDEARLVADYEKCGRHCCCRQFLKVLRPVSMRAAKTQKATLDPAKISGRCGRLMCCLRYEDESYERLKRQLPRRGTRVGTPQGPGVVVDGQILTQLVLVRLESDCSSVAVPVEELCDPNVCPTAPVAPPVDHTCFVSAVSHDAGEAGDAGGRKRSRRRGGRKRKRSAEATQAQTEPATQNESSIPEQDSEAGEGRRRKRRRRKRKGAGSSEGPASAQDVAPDPTTGDGLHAERAADQTPTGEASTGEGAPKRRKRKRRKRKKKPDGS